MARQPKTPPLGVTDRALLRKLSTGKFTGTVTDLARTTQTQERYLWTSIAGLAELGLVEAAKAADGRVRIAITAAGSQAHREALRQYRSSGFVPKEQRERTESTKTANRQRNRPSAALRAYPSASLPKVRFSD